MPVIEDPMIIEPRRGTIYPDPFKAPYEGRLKRGLSAPFGLTQFGVNVTTLQPGARSSERHWHAREDECIYILSGEAVLVTDEGEQILTPGMAAGFAAGVVNGHQLINRSVAPVTYIEIGARSPDDVVTYPDVDMHAVKTANGFKVFHKNGEPY
jgi:uncharacterized cupin superfamily protein